MILTLRTLRWLGQALIGLGLLSPLGTVAAFHLRTASSWAEVPSDDLR